MKYLIIFILFLSITGCSKSNKDKCYECQQLLERKEGPVLVSSSTTTTTDCDKSESEVKDLEQQNTYTKTENGVTTTSKFKCKLK